MVEILKKKKNQNWYKNKIPTKEKQNPFQQIGMQKCN